MSPSCFDVGASAAREFHQHAAGHAYGGYNVSSVLGLRPVINLKSDVEISGGVGTSDNPYIVKTA